MGICTLSFVIDCRSSQFMVGRSATDRSWLDNPWLVSFPSRLTKSKAPGANGGIFAVVLQGRLCRGTLLVELEPRSMTPDEYEAPKLPASGGAWPEDMAPTAPGYPGMVLWMPILRGFLYVFVSCPKRARSEPPSLAANLPKLSRLREVIVI